MSHVLSRTFLTAAALLAAAGLALAASGCGRKHAAPAESGGAPRVVSVHRVEADAPGGALVLPARVAAREEVTVTATRGGQVTELPVAEGQPFAAGRVLARFDEPETREALLAAAAAATAAEARLETARKQEERLVELQGQRVASLRELELAREDARAAEAAFAQARAAHVALRTGAEVSVPFAGVVVRHHVDPGTSVGPGQPLLDVRSTGAGEILVPVPETAADRLRGAVARYQIGDGPWRPATLARLDGMVDFTTRTRTARLRPADRAGRLEPGAFARARFDWPAATPATAGPGGNAENASRSPTVPSRCLVRRGGLVGAFVVQEGRATLRWIRAGRSDSLATEVLAGLSPGDEIVIDPGDLRDGQAVTTAGR